MSNSNWVPTYLFGGGYGSNNMASYSSGAAQLIELMTAKTAKELNLDLSQKSK